MKKSIMLNGMKYVEQNHPLLGRIFCIRNRQLSKAMDNEQPTVIIGGL